MFSKLLFHSKICTKRNVLLFSNKKCISDSIVNYKIKTKNNDNKINTQNDSHNHNDNYDNENENKNNINKENIKVKIKLKLKKNLLNENNPYNDRED